MTVVYVLKISGWRLYFNSRDIGAARHFARWLCRQNALTLRDDVLKASKSNRGRWLESYWEAQARGDVRDWDRYFHVLPVRC
jgi:hypothetical protein